MKPFLKGRTAERFIPDASGVTQPPPFIRELLRQHGRCSISYSTLQPGLHYWITPGMGYIAYQTLAPCPISPLGKRVVLSDPVCHQDHWEQMTLPFIKENSPVLFLQISREYADFLRAHLPFINQCGVETEINLTDFSLKGKKMGQVRHWINTARHKGVSVLEMPIEKMPLADIKAVSHHWLQKRGKRELTFLTRPLVPVNEPDVRYFWAIQERNIVGMLIFDPIYQSGVITGYYHNFVRLLPNAPHGTSDLMTLEAIKVFSSEGVDKISFGLSPLAGLEQETSGENALTSRLLRGLYQSSPRMIYNFKANIFHKRKYHGHQKPVYFAGTDGNGIRDILASLRAIGMF